MTNALKMNEKKSKKYPQIFICGVSSFYKAKIDFLIFQKYFKNLRSNLSLLSLGGLERLTRNLPKKKFTKFQKSLVQNRCFCHWEG